MIDDNRIGPPHFAPERDMLRAFLTSTAPPWR